MITASFPQLEKSIIIDPITTIDFTNPSMFASFITCLNANLLGFGEEDEIRLFDEHDKQIPLSGLLFVYDVLTFDFNARPITTAIQKNLQKRVSEEAESWEPMRLELQKLDDAMNNFLLDDPLELEVDDEWDINRLCKVYGVKLKCDPLLSCLERAEKIIEVTNTLHLAHLIVFKNLSRIFSELERKQLYLFALNETVPLLVLESGEIKSNELETVIQIDADYYEKELPKTPLKNDKSEKLDFIGFRVR